MKKNIFYIFILLFQQSYTCFIKAEENTKMKIIGIVEQQTFSVITNKKTITIIDLSKILNEDNKKVINPIYLNFKLIPLEGEEIIKKISINHKSEIEILTKKMGIARYKLIVSGNKKYDLYSSIQGEITIISEFLMDFTQSRPFEVGGSLKGISYPNDNLVSVSRKVIGVDKKGQEVFLNPALLVTKKIGIYPHNNKNTFPDFSEDIKYYGYKQNRNHFKFRYEPLIPMLIVGDGRRNRGVGIIVINKNKIQNNSKISYQFEGYANIRTRSYHRVTYNLGVVISTINKKKVKYKDTVRGRDYFSMGYSTSGQIFSKPFFINNNDYLVISIVGEAGLGGDRRRTTRFEYIRIYPTIK